MSSAPAGVEAPESLHMALLAVQSELQGVGFGKDGKGEVTYQTKGGGSGRFNYGYLTYPKLLERVRPLLTRNSLVWQTFPTTLDGKPALYYAMVFAPDGTKVDGTMLLMMEKQTSQAQGSAITYARRYALLAVLEIAPAGEDDDGAAASRPARPLPTDPDVPLPQDAFERMQEAVAERGWNMEAVLSRVGVAADEHPTVGQGRQVKQLLEQTGEVS